MLPSSVGVLNLAAETVQFPICAKVRFYITDHGSLFRLQIFAIKFFFSNGSASSRLSFHGFPTFSSQVGVVDYHCGS